MRTGPLITCLWPGLSHLWLRGRWRGLVVASIFAVLLNLALAATYLWPQWLNKPLVLLVWLAAGCLWIVSVVCSWRDLRHFLADNSSDESLPGLFIRAQAEYLRGNWFEAESLFQHLTDVSVDLEANLMLATLYRRTGRYDDARRRLRVLAQAPGADAWRWEIDAEYKLLKRLANPAASRQADADSRTQQESGMPEAA